MVLLRHTSTGTDVDIALGMLPFETEMVDRSAECRTGNVSIRLPTPEDLIIVKAVAHRRRDLADIESIVQAHPNLDRKRIETYVRAFAGALDSPELWDDIASLL
jgi:predicted nucleotidyltransferase